jgi:hypothetical protein
MERRTFIQRVCAASAVTSAGLAGCANFGAGESDGSDGGGGDGGGGDDGGDGGGGDDGGDDGGDGGDGETTSGDTPTESPTMAPQTVAGGERAFYDDWASEDTYITDEFQAFSVRAGAGQSTPSTPTPTPTPTPEGTDAPLDPILGYSTTYLVAALFSGFALAGFNVGQVTSDGGGAERIHVPGESLVFEGSFDSDALQSSVGDSEASESGTYEGYTTYEMGSGEDLAVLGVSGEALVHASAGEAVSDPRSVVESTIDAGTGNATPYGSDNPAYEELVTALPESTVMGTSFAKEGDVTRDTPTPTPEAGGGGGSDFFEIRDFDLEGAVRGFATAWAFEQDQESTTPRMAIRYASESEVDDTSLIREQAAPRAADVSVTSSGALVVVAATYTEDQNL